MLPSGNNLLTMFAPWISLLAGVAVVVLVAYALRQRSRAATDAAYIDELERLVQSRGDEFAQLSKLSATLSGVMEIDVLKRTIQSEVAQLAGTDEFWIVAHLNGWVLLAGEPADPGAVVPRALTGSPEAWESFPLNAGGKTVGLMGIKQPPGGFREEQRRTLASVATLMASSVKNIYLFNRVRDLSMIDPLTRCLMRQFGVEALAREIRRMRRAQSELCVAVLDLDRFKELNDTYGHPVGDRALAMVGRVLKETLRVSDVACRYGGDEFLIVLPETSLAGAVRAVENLRRKVNDTPLDSPAGPIMVSASFGVTAVELSEEDPALPITRADAAMYEAKRAGRNHVGVKTAAPRENPETSSRAV